MRFDSLTFFAFLIVVVLLHHALPWRIGRVMLLLASYLFYGATELWYVLLLFISTYVDYLVALALGRESRPLKRRGLICISIATNMGMLAVFKYAAFFTSNLNAIAPLHLPVPTWILPIGISFYSFQTLAYSIDVYRRRIEPERDFITFALYVSFFPQLVAGPIERAQQLLPQLRLKQRVTADDITYGVQRILVGLFKKLVLADRIAFAVDPFYAHVETASATDLVLATVSFAFRLYLDFSAYTDIAIGLARLVGVRLAENFNRPFLARDVTDFLGALAHDVNRVVPRLRPRVHGRLEAWPAVAQCPHHHHHHDLGGHLARSRLELRGLRLSRRRRARHLSRVAFDGVAARAPGRYLATVGLAR